MIDISQLLIRLLVIYCYYQNNQKDDKMTRNKQVVVRLTEDEKKLAEQYAKSLHTPLAVVLRQLILVAATKEVVC